MSFGGLINRFEGTRGEIRIPELSVLVCEMTRPLLLRRRAENGQPTGQFDLHAAVSYFTQALWDDPEFTKEITVWIGKDPLKVMLNPESKMTVDGTRLRIEGVNAE